ncbi:zinc ABC transporter substrate-binding protein [uncultured Roseobacter sp.]|uniref:zinc ABC transporter substrate-binding protein n=1 Tax=uncultured Roseobacter sp. TaxID=114847 RepID=UPI00261F4716|nr:zinc ABC transporter substrate-binding protein [uncultured Roseobacter sp.]
MRQLSGLFACFVLLAAAARAEAPRVATDIGPVHSLVSQVMQGAGEPDLLIPPGASPHAYAMRPSEARALSRADVVFWIGPSLTPWLAGPVETLAASARHVTLTETDGVTLLAFREGADFSGHDHAVHDKAEDHGHDDEHGHDGHDDHDDHAGEEGHHDDHDDHAGEEGHHDDHDEHAGEERHHDAHDEHAAEKGHDDHTGHADDKDHAGHDGHDHDGADPHLWLDPENAQVWLAMIADVLAEIDPENADLYQRNAETAAASVAAQQAVIRAQMAPLHDQPFVVFHDAYHYFEARFDVSAVAAITLADAGAASAGRLSEVRAAVGRAGAACALNDPSSGEGLIDAVASEDGLRIVTADPVGAGLIPGPGFYGALLQQIADALTECLGGA